MLTPKVRIFQYPYLSQSPTSISSTHLIPLPNVNHLLISTTNFSNVSSISTQGSFARRQMVSSAPAPLINPPVSYAERVKKAHSPRSPHLVLRNSPLDFPASPSASAVSPPSNVPKPPNPVEIVGGSQAGVSDFPELPTEVSSQYSVKDHNERTNTYVQANSYNAPKAAPAVNVWTERMKEQTQVHQGHKQPRAIATSSVRASLVPPRSRPIIMGTPSHILDIPNTTPSASTSHSSPSQTTSLNGSDDGHDPFVVRMPPHLSRHSSSKSISIVNEIENAAPGLEHRKPPSIDLVHIDGPEKSGRSEGHADADAHNPPNSADLSRKSTLFASIPFKHPTFRLPYNRFLNMLRRC